MPTHYDPNWAAAWSNTSINGGSISDASNATTAAISNDEVGGTEVSVRVTYGGTATEGIKVYVLRDLDGTNYETVNDNPWGIELPYAVSGSRSRVFTIPSQLASNFKIHVTNDSGAAVTCTVKTRQFTLDQLSS